MTLPLLLTIALLALTSCGFSTPKDEFPPGLPHGEFTLPTDAPWFDSADKPGARFDFSAGAWVFEPDAPKEGDIAFYRTFMAGSGPLHVGLQDTMPESLNYTKMAPTSGYDTAPEGNSNDVKMPIYSSHVYWIKTAEGHYAKIKIDAAEMNADGTGYDRLVIKWVYQPDGSDDFHGKANPGDGATNGEGDARGLGAAHGLDTEGGGGLY
ncbi:MAG: hypothetical protein ABI743_01100 [bacterium]